MKDYDPVLFYQWSVQGTTRGSYNQIPFWQLPHLKKKALLSLQDTGRAARIAFADYIAQIHVEATISTTDTTAATATQSIGVVATVTDTIKGQRYIECSDSLITNYGLMEEGLYRAKQSHVFPLDAENCFQFEYRPAWLRIARGYYGSTRDSLTVMPDGTPWIMPGGDYIVILEFVHRYDGDSTFTNATLTPIPSRCTGMYPIIDGIVYDPYNDFGFGHGLTADQWKAAMRAKISTILHP